MHRILFIPHTTLLNQFGEKGDRFFHFVRILDMIPKQNQLIICPYRQRQVQKIIKFGFCTPGRFERCVTCRNFPKPKSWTLCGQLFVTMSLVGNQIPISMPDSCTELSANSFDTHHDHVEPKGPKLLPFLHFDPGFGRDTRGKLKCKVAYSRRHLIAF